MLINSLEMYQQATEALSELEGYADKLANIFCSRSALFNRFGLDRVVYEYNDSCNCHPETAEGSFPAKFLFLPESAAIEEKARLDKEQKMQQEAQRLRAQKAAEQAQELLDAKEYERLRQKYEGEER